MVALVEGMGLRRFFSASAIGRGAAAGVGVLGISLGLLWSRILLYSLLYFLSNTSDSHVDYTLFAIEMVAFL